MAEKIVFEIDVDEKGAVKSLNKIEEGVEDIGKQTKKSESGIKKFGKSLGNIAKGAGIIGLLTAAFEALREALGNNQKVMDALSTATTALGIAFNDLFNFIFNNAGKVVEFFQEIFENPTESLKELGEAIKDNIIERFNSAIEVIGFLSDAFKKVFEGDFQGAIEAAKNAGKEYIDVLTGVDGTVDKVGTAIVEATEAVVDYTVATYEQAEAITEQQKSLRLLELQQTRIREQSDRDAEQQRQIRDDETRGIEERIEANRRLGEILDEQQEREQQTVKDRIASLEQQQTQLGFSQERYEEIYALQTELIAIEAQQAGFRSEQLINENQLLKEKAELYGFQTQAELDSFNASIEGQISKAEAEYAISEKKVADELALLDAKYAAELEKAEQFGQDTTAITAKYESDKTDIAKKAAEADEKIKNRKLANDFNTAKQLSNDLQTLAGEGTEASKAAGVAGVAIDVAKGLTGALAGWSSLGPLGIAGAVASSAAIVATGIKSVKSILAVKSGSKNATANSGSVSASAAPPTATVTPPSFSTAADGGTNQLAADIADINQQQPVQAYVVSTEVTNQQQLDRNTEKNATF